jgi:Arc/MetJ-type ribon-helix-helix transcriptional regulator
VTQVGARSALAAWFDREKRWLDPRGMTVHHTRRNIPGGAAMGHSKIAITLEEETLEQLDELVSRRVFPSRSRAIQVALAEKLQRVKRTRLARECAKLDPKTERAVSEEGVTEALDEWPEY